MKSEFEVLVEYCHSIPGLEFEIRGSEHSRFIFGRVHGRPFELSVSPPGYFFEAWAKSDEDTYDDPEISVEVASLDELDVSFRG